MNLASISIVEDGASTIAATSFVAAFILAITLLLPLDLASSLKAKYGTAISMGLRAHLAQRFKRAHYWVIIQTALLILVLVNVEIFENIQLQQTLRDDINWLHDQSLAQLLVTYENAQHFLQGVWFAIGVLTTLLVIQLIKRPWLKLESANLYSQVQSEEMEAKAPQGS